MRFPVGVLLLGAVGCAGPREPVALDPLASARAMVAGFREANPDVAWSLDHAVAWGAFSTVEHTTPPCRHSGTLFQLGAEPRLAVLRCVGQPASQPLSGTPPFHALVVLREPADLALLAEGGLDLGTAAVLTPHDRPDVSVPENGRLVVTSDRGGLLWELEPPRLVLELAPRD